MDSHAFRGLNYGYNSRTLDRLMDINAYFAFAVCMLRQGYNNTADTSPFDVEFGDGCPQNANILNLLFPSVFPYVAVDSSYYFEYDWAHDQPRELNCLDCDEQWWPSRCGDGKNQRNNETCDFNGLARTVWSNDGNNSWQAYKIGCQLNFSRVICDLSDDPTPPKDAGVAPLLRLMFVVMVCVCIAVLLLVFAALCRRYRKLRDERIMSQLVDSLDSDRYWMRFEGEDEGDGLGGAGLIESPRSHLLK